MQKFLGFYNLNVVKCSNNKAYMRYFPYIVVNKTNKGGLNVSYANTALMYDAYGAERVKSDVPFVLASFCLPDLLYGVFFWKYNI